MGRALGLAVDRDQHPAFAEVVLEPLEFGPRDRQAGDCAEQRAKGPGADCCDQSSEQGAKAEPAPDHQSPEYPAEQRRDDGTDQGVGSGACGRPWDILIKQSALVLGHADDVLRKATPLQPLDCGVRSGPIWEETVGDALHVASLTHDRDRDRPQNRRSERSENLAAGEKVGDSLQARSSRAEIEAVPGTLHQGILALFQDDPWLAFDLLSRPRPTAGTPTDRRAEVEFEGRTPYEANQAYPDLVLVDDGDARADPEQPGAVVTVEAQRKVDVGKRYRIPVYQALLAQHHQVSTWVVVVSLSRPMSALLRSWGEGPPPKVDAMILDVDTVPIRPWIELINERPTAVVLAAILHGYAGNIDAARAGLRAALTLPEPRRRRYAMTVLAALPKRRRALLKGELPMQNRDELDEIERASGTFHYGFEEGYQEGRRLGLIDLTLGSLAERGIPLDATSEARIRSCKTLAQLERWARRSTHVSSVAELLLDQH